MSSTVACIGFTDPGSLAAIVRDEGEPFHELSSTNKWIDSSGAMLLLDRTAQLARPGFATHVRTPYKSVVPLQNGLAQITITDVSGRELAPFTVIPDARYTVGWAPTGRVALVAMGIDTEFFATAEDFYDSPRSSLPHLDTEPPPEVKQFGLPWPPVMEIETFIPDENQNEPTATLSGTVQFAEVHKNSRTGHEFLVSRIATVCGEIDLCTPLPLDGAPAPGGVVVGQVELLAGFPPHGVADASTYVPPSDRVNPTFREGEPMSLADLPAADAGLPAGLVLGEDGVVRTTAEHQAWKGGDADAGFRSQEDIREHEADQARRSALGDPENQPADGSAPQQGGEGYPGDHTQGDASTHNFEGNNVNSGAQQGPTAGGPSAPSQSSAQTSSESPAQSQTGASAGSGDDDAAPRPGETRREWRARTGR